MTPRLLQPIIDKILGKNRVKTLNRTYDKKVTRLNKIAKRISFNKATQEELEIFEKYKKDIGVDSVLYNKQTKECVFL